MDGRIDLTISHFVRKEKKKKKKKQAQTYCQFPLNRHSRIQCYITLTFPTFPLLFVSTTTRRGRLPCSPTCQILSSSFLSLSPSLSLCQSSRETTLAFGASNEIYMLSKEDAYNQHSKISLYAKLFVNETNQNNRRDATFNSRVS